MRSAMIKTAIAILFVAAAAVADVSAQRAKVDVKFDFRIGDRAFPAGSYDIEEVNPTNPGFLRILNNTVGVSRLAMARPHEQVTGAASPHLIFERFGGEYYLTRLLLDGSRPGYAFSRPAGEPQGKLAVAAAAERKRDAKGN